MSLYTFIIHNTKSPYNRPCTGLVRGRGSATILAADFDVFVFEIPALCEPQTSFLF